MTGNGTSDERVETASSPTLQKAGYCDGSDWLGTIKRLGLHVVSPAVTPEVRRSDPEGIDYGWVMQVTFILTILLGAPLVALLSLLVSVPTWTDRAIFAIQVGAPIWLVTALLVYVYERRQSTLA